MIILLPPNLLDTVVLGVVGAVGTAGGSPQSYIIIYKFVLFIFIIII